MIPNLGAITAEILRAATPWAARRVLANHGLTFDQYQDELEQRLAPKDLWQLGVLEWLRADLPE